MVHYDDRRIWPLPYHAPTRGATFLVKVDCVTLKPRPDSEQDPIYAIPGVKRPRGNAYMDSVEAMWSKGFSSAALKYNEKCARNPDGGINQDVKQEYPPTQDCISAVSIDDGSDGQICSGI